MTLQSLSWILAAAALAGCIPARGDTPAAARRPGLVQFSDGTVATGLVSMTPGRDLALHGASGFRRLELARVREIRLRPEREEFLRSYRFPEAGRAVKEEHGLPYPVRHLAADLALANGETLSGHLVTTVLYLETAEETEKILLPAKQRGTENQTLDALVYPVRVLFGDANGGGAPAPATAVLAAGPAVGRAGPAELCALTRGALVRLEASRPTAAGEFPMPSPLGADLFVAVREGDVIRVGWPADTGDPLRARLEEALGSVRDFFDSRRLLGVLRDAPSGNVYSLMLLSRQGPTTLAADRNLPWRCEIWRWRHDAETGRLLLAGRGYFFRGILGRGETPPRVLAAPALWPVRMEGNRIVIGTPQP